MKLLIDIKAENIQEALSNVANATVTELNTCKDCAWAARSFIGKYYACSRMNGEEVGPDDFCSFWEDCNE